jgi:hypothetical protein
MDTPFYINTAEKTRIIIHENILVIRNVIREVIHSKVESSINRRRFCEHDTAPKMLTSRFVRRNKRDHRSITECTCDIEGQRNRHWSHYILAR